MYTKLILGTLQIATKLWTDCCPHYKDIKTKHYNIQPIYLQITTEQSKVPLFRQGSPRWQLIVGFGCLGGEHYSKSLCRTDKGLFGLKMCRELTISKEHTWSRCFFFCFVKSYIESIFENLTKAYAIPLVLPWLILQFCYRLWFE